MIAKSALNQFNNNMAHMYSADWSDYIRAYIMEHANEFETLSQILDSFEANK